MNLKLLTGGQGSCGVARRGSAADVLGFVLNCFNNVRIITHANSHPWFRYRFSLFICKSTQWGPVSPQARLYAFPVPILFPLSRCRLISFKECFLRELASFFIQMDVNVLDFTTTSIKGGSTLREVRERPQY